MSITRAISDTDGAAAIEAGDPSVKAVADYPGYPGTLYLRTEYVGRVLGTWERNGYDDSDFFATVMEDDGSIRQVEYASTRGWTYANGASVDATPEVQAAYAAMQHDAAVARDIAREAAEAATPYKGRTVRVVKGRKVPIGTTGVVFYREQSKYQSRYRTFLDAPAYRIGFRDAAGDTHFTADSNVEVATQGAESDLATITAD